MLTQKQREYDNYVTSGSGDICFIYGMSGHCGPECPEFGMRDGCVEEAQKYQEEGEDAK